MVKKDYPFEKVVEESMEDASEEDFLKIKKLLNEESVKYTKAYILRMLNTKESLRKVFLAVIKNNPSRVSEICEYSLIQKQNVYTLLNQLVSLGLVKRVFVNDIVSGKVKKNLILKKFNQWTKNMPENTRRYYLSKTSYWEVSEFGKKFVVKAYEFDHKFKEKK